MFRPLPEATLFRRRPLSADRVRPLDSGLVVSVILLFSLEQEN